MYMYKISTHLSGSFIGIILKFLTVIYLQISKKSFDRKIFNRIYAIQLIAVLAYSHLLRTKYWYIYSYEIYVQLNGIQDYFK